MRTPIFTYHVQTYPIDITDEIYERGAFTDRAQTQVLRSGE
ncbi:MAG: hypothetical protein AAFQ36_14000 [Pseudomonadota bacterium]